MDQWLAQVYGTNAADDLEKTAQLHILQKLAEEEGIDLSGLDENQLQELADQVLADDGTQQEPEQVLQPGDPGFDMNPTQLAPAQQYQQMMPQQQQYQQPVVPQGYNPALMAQQQMPSPEMLAKEAQAKFEEADFLGRVMAHSYTQELEKIAGAREMAGKAYGAVKGKAQQLGGSMKARTAPGSSSNVRKAMDHVGRNKGRYGAGAAAAGGFAAGRMSKREKTASAFEKLATERAAEILSANGIDPSTGAPAQQQQAPQMGMPQQGQPQMGGQPGQQFAPPQDDGAQFEHALDSRALEILQEHGYDVSALLGGDDQGQDQHQQ